MERRGQSQDSLEAEWAGLPAVRAVAQAERGGHERRVWGLVRGGEKEVTAGSSCAGLSPAQTLSEYTASTYGEPGQTEVEAGSNRMF